MSGFTILSLLDPWLVFLSDDPTLRLMQGGMLLGGGLVVFLVFFATRDILLRSQSFWYMFASIILVAALPIIGFLLYLLIRPARTIKERELEAMVAQLLEKETHHKKSEKTVEKKGKKPHSKSKKSS